MKKQNHRQGFSTDWPTIFLWLGAVGVIALAAVLGIQRFSRMKMSAAMEIPDKVTFHRDVAPIVYSHCSTCHHPGESAPFDLLNFADVKKRTRQIADVTARRIMPPWLPEPGHGEFVGERSLSARQIQIIQKWIGQGAPEGDISDAPPAPKWQDGRQLGRPDLIIQLPTPYELPAEGRDVYRNFVIPIPVSSRRYVRAVELLPGNARAVHHAFMYVDATRESRRKDAQDAEPGFPGLHTPSTAQAPAGQFLSWQPGKVHTAEPPELGWVLEKDTDLILQMHLRPSGRPELVQPSVGFYFSDTRPTRTPFKFGLWSHEIDIPAGQSNYVVQDSYTLPLDLDVLKVLPHAHYLGREMQGYATLPDGSTRWLINIRNWDFNWQGDYAFAQPVFLPKGSTVFMRWVYDNSTNNIRNPNQPPHRVRYGVNSSDEMAELWFQALPRRAGELPLLEKDYQPRIFRSAISYNNYVLGLDPGNAKSYTELGKAHLFLQEIAAAESNLRRAIQLRADDDEPHYYLGLLCRMTGRLPEAVTEFQTTTRINPQHYKAYGNLGLIHLDEGRAAEAEVHFQTALRINPDDVVARESLDLIAKSLGQTGKK